ncbi:MAG: glycosyltransferase family 39 protein [Bacteroidia bacterium]
MNKINSRITSNILLLVFVILLFLICAFNKTYKYRPNSIHQWRQTDCLSMTKNYYEEGMHFFSPKIHWQGSNNGNAVSECPILNYSVAALWKMFGEHEFIYRFLEYFIFIISMFVLFNTLVRFFGSTWLSFFITSLFLTSPLLVYYSFNFIADVPALSFCILAFCIFFRFYKTKKIGYFYLALLLGTIAVLLKASAATGIGIILFFSMIDILGLNRFFKTEKLFTKKLLPLISIVAVLGLIYSWYKFAIAYNTYNNSVFLLTVLPIWEMKDQAIYSNLRSLFSELFPLFFSKPMFFLFFVFAAYVIANFKKLDIFFKYTFLFSAVFFVFYILFFFQVFTGHDYYLNNLMIFPVITFFCLANILSQNAVMENNKKFIRIAIVTIIILNSFFAAAYYRLRVIKDDKLCVWYPFITNEEKRFNEWFLWNRELTLESLETLTPDLRKAGVKREDLVLSIPDVSFDISLYLMDQKGYTMPSDLFVADSNTVNIYIGKKIKYLVLSDIRLKDEASFGVINNHFDLIIKKPLLEVYKLKE